MARTPVATDGFAYGGTPGDLSTQSGGVYTHLDSAGSGDPQYNGSGQITGEFSGFSSPAVRSAGTYANNQYVSIKYVSGLDLGSADSGMGVIARASTDLGADRDYFYAEGRADDTYIYGVVVNGANTTLGSGPHNWSANDKVEIEIEGESPNITARIMKNDGATLIHESTGVTGPNSGRPGVLTRGAGVGDDFEAGDLTGGGEPPPPTLRTVRSGLRW